MMSGGTIHASVASISVRASKACPNAINHATRNSSVPEVSSCKVYGSGVMRGLAPALQVLGRRLPVDENAGGRIVAVARSWKGGAPWSVHLSGNAATRVSITRISLRNSCGVIRSIAPSSSASAAGIAARRNPSPRGDVRGRGASNFLVDPGRGADVCPAFWRADHNPSVILVEHSATCETGFEIALNARMILVEAKTEAGRHMVLAGRRARHRLRMMHAPKRGGYFVPGDASLPVRLAALGAFHDHGSRQAVGLRKALRPTSYQRHRLSLLLAILDRMQQPSSEPATVRQIVRDLMCSGLEHERAIEWKTSSYRRQAQRLIAEARRMMTTGYRDLLRGSMRPVVTDRHRDGRDTGDRLL